jgi:hypothetical protein
LVGLVVEGQASEVFFGKKRVCFEGLFGLYSLPIDYQSAVFYQRDEEVPSIDFVDVEIHPEVIHCMRR